MTRIGFAYNQKPDAAGVGSSIELARAEDEPPSNGAGAATMVAPAAVADDELAEWAAPSTIDAVAAPLGRLGGVVCLEAPDDFPQRLRQSRADIVFNIAEGLRGPNREAHVPAICEFYGIPYSGSDPFTLALCLDKARTKEILRARGVPTADWWLVRTPAELAAIARHRPRLPLFAKPLHESSSKAITDPTTLDPPPALN